jgi:hypothetical protein
VPAEVEGLRLARVSADNLLYSLPSCQQLHLKNNRPALQPSIGESVI